MREPMLHDGWCVADVKGERRVDLTTQQRAISEWPDAEFVWHDQRKQLPKRHSAKGEDDRPHKRSLQSGLDLPRKSGRVERNDLEVTDQ